MKQGGGGGEPSSKLDKLRRSVRGRLHDPKGTTPFSSESVDTVLKELVRVIETHWKR